MAALGELVVSLSANTAKFNEGLSKAEFQTQKAFSKMKTQVGMLGTAVAGAFTTQAIFEFARAAIVAADAINDVAKANDVAVSAVLNLSRALSLNGGEADAAGKLFSSLTNKIDEAAGGSEKAQQAFSKIGISLKDLATLDGQDLFEKTLQGIAKMPDTISRNAMAMDLFGKAAKGVDIRGLAQDFENGKGEFKDAEKSFNDIGVALDKLDAMQMKVSTNLATALGPALLKTVEAAEKIGPALLESLPVMGLMIRAMNMFNEESKKAAGREQSGKIRFNNPPILREVTPFKSKEKKKELADNSELAKTYADLYQSIIQLNDADKSQTDILRDKLNAISNVDQATKSYIITQLDQIDAEAERKALIAENVEKQKEFNAEVEKIKDSIDPTREYTREIQKLGEMFELKRLSPEEFSKAAEMAQKRMLDFAETGKSEFEELKDAIEGFSRDAAQSLVDFAFGASSSFEQVANDFAKAITRMIIQKQLLDPLFSGISQSMSGGGTGGILDSLFGSVVSGYFGGSSSGGVSASAGAYSIDANPYLNFGGARASGGHVSANSAYLVGEQGPELFMPSGNGTIIPNNSLGGNVSVTNVFHLSGQTDMRTQQQIASAAYSGALRAARRNN